jgi:hypothetical protein
MGVARQARMGEGEARYQNQSGGEKRAAHDGPHRIGSVRQLMNKCIPDANASPVLGED